MVEVGYRFNSFYFAIEDKNYNLAHYQLDKIKKQLKMALSEDQNVRQIVKLCF